MSNESLVREQDTSLWPVAVAISGRSRIRLGTHAAVPLVE